jgi:hypothetical protein
VTRLASEQPSLVKSLLLKKPVLVSGEQTIGHLQSIVSLLRDAIDHYDYSESSGFDCGWHLEPNPQVSRHLHSQERESPDETYAYDEFTLTATSVVGVLWEVLDSLETRLRKW